VYTFCFILTIFLNLFSSSDKLLAPLILIHLTTLEVVIFKFYGVLFSTVIIFPLILDLLLLQNIESMDAVCKNNAITVTTQMCLFAKIP
jgi:hypothetical protein